MTIDATTPRSRRALLAGLLGGLAASAATFVRAPSARAGVDGDLVLEDTNNSSAQTELIATTQSAGLRVLSDGIGLQGWGDIGVDAYGSSIAVNAIGDGASAPAVVAWNRGNALGLLGWSTDGSEATPSVPAKTAILGIAEQDDAAARGVVGSVTTGQGVRGEATTGIGVAAISTSGPAIDAQSDSAAAILAESSSAEAIHALNASATVASIVAEGGPGTGIHGHTPSTPIPNSPALTGVYGSAAGSGVAIAADAASGLAVRATSSASHGIRGRGQLDGVIGESPGNRSGIVGYSGSGSAPAGPAKTGVYGEATQDAASRGVSGLVLAGQGVRGEATTGIGVKAVATTGLALDVSGRAQFSRSGRASIPANRDYVDVVVPGGLSSTANVLALLQIKRGGIHVVAARPNYPTSGKVRINLNGVASKTVSTPVAWFVLG